MTEIERRGSSGGVANIGMAPTSDPTNWGWSPIQDWNWHSFGDLDESIVAKLSQEGLLPSNILIESFPPPVEGIVNAWIVGSNGFSIFKIIPAGAKQWSVIGKITQFKSQTILLTDSLSSSAAPGLGSGSGGSAPAGITLSEELSSAEMLPERLRKKLHAIKTPWHEVASAVRYSGSPGENASYKVVAITSNASQVFALSAIQEVTVFVGESESAISQRLKNANWNIEMVYEKFA
jgi:hypothetical protein